MEPVNCNLCGGNSHKVLFSSFDQTFPTAERFRLVRCKECGLVFINPRPENYALGRYYLDDYFSCYEEIREEADAIQERKIKIAAVKKAGCILDIGCGRGEFLFKMQERGWQAFGVEISPVASAYAKEKLGLKNIYSQDILELSLPGDFFDIITLWHVIEHLPNPAETLKKIHALLKKDGTLIINCPNFNSLLRIIFRENWYQLDAPRHLYQFTPQTLGRILKTYGFEIEEISYNPFPLHSMIWFKISIFRWLGLKDLLYSYSKTASKQNKLKSFRAIWFLLRNIFNLICHIIAFVLSLLGLGDDMCIKARKIEGS